jgi:hypothetical protein
LSPWFKPQNKKLKKKSVDKIHLLIIFKKLYSNTMAGGTINDMICPECENIVTGVQSDDDVCLHCISEDVIVTSQQFNNDEFNNFVSHVSGWNSTSTLEEECGNYSIWRTLINNTELIAERNNTTLDEIHQYTAADFVTRCLAGIYKIPNTVVARRIMPCDCESCRYITGRMLLCVSPHNDIAYPSYDVAHDGLYPLALNPDCPNKSIYIGEQYDISEQMQQRDNTLSWTDVATECWYAVSDVRWNECECPVCLFEVRHRAWISGNVEAALISHERIDDAQAAPPAPGWPEDQQDIPTTYSPCAMCGMNIQDDDDGSILRQHNIIECRNAAQ